MAVSAIRNVNRPLYRRIFAQILMYFLHKGLSGPYGKTLDFRCGFQRVLSAFAARRRDSAETYGNPVCRTRAEKRVSFRGVMKRHLSVF
jgi:hypothetical protein